MALQPSSRPAPRGVARGGRAIYGAPLGILMLEARFPRIPGDMGNAGTWPFPVLYKVVRGASPERVVLEGARGLLPDFLDAAAELVRLGAEAITTNCGFLSLFQAEIAAHAGVPVAHLVAHAGAWVQATLPPGKRVGLLTVSARPSRPPTSPPPASGRHPGGGTGERPGVLPRADPRGEGRHGRGRGRAGHPGRRARPRCPAPRGGRDRARMHQHAALRRGLREAVGLPVFDIYSMVAWFHAGLRPRAFGG
jgi:hypothetical protein